jgi:hypothetical protein
MGTARTLWDIWSMGWPNWWSPQSFNGKRIIMQLYLPSNYLDTLWWLFILFLENCMCCSGQLNQGVLIRGKVPGYPSHTLVLGLFGVVQSPIHIRLCSQASWTCFFLPHHWTYLGNSLMQMELGRSHADSSWVAGPVSGPIVIFSYWLFSKAVLDLLCYLSVLTWL